MPNRAVKGELKFAQIFSSTFVLRILENLFDKYWKYVSTPRGPYLRIEYAEGHYFQKTLTTHGCPKTIQQFNNSDSCFLLDTFKMEIKFFILDNFFLCDGRGHIQQQDGNTRGCLRLP